MILDHPWYFVMLCLLVGAAYAGILYHVGHNRFPRGLRWGLTALRFVAVSAIAFLLLAPLTKQDVTERQLPTVILGGTGFESARQDMPDSIPERFEMGTMNISGLSGLNAAVKWIKETRVDEIRSVETKNRE